MSAAKPRNAAIAALLNVLVTGLGFLYLGSWRWALGSVVAVYSIYAIGGWANLVFTPLGCLLINLSVFIIWIALIVIAIQRAGRMTAAPLSRSQRWYFYLAFAIAISAIGQFFASNRSAILGFDMFRIPSSNMNNTLVVGDFVVTNPRKYHNANPQRLDIVVFIPPFDRSTPWIKRVIGLPGETVETHENRVFIDGVELDEPYIDPKNNTGQIGIADVKIVVPEGHFFMLGDNRDNSLDSRRWGTVPTEDLRGRVEFIWMNWDAMIGGIRTERIGMRVNLD